MKNQQKNELLIQEMNDLIDENIELLRKVNKSKNNKISIKHQENELIIKKKLRSLIHSEILSLKNNKNKSLSNEIVNLVVFLQSIDPTYFDEYISKDLCVKCFNFKNNCICKQSGKEIKKLHHFHYQGNSNNYHLYNGHHGHDDHHTHEHHLDSHHVDAHHCDNAPEHHLDAHHLDAHDGHYAHGHHANGHHCDDHHLHGHNAHGHPAHGHPSHEHHLDAHDAHPAHGHHAHGHHAHGYHANGHHSDNHHIDHHLHGHHANGHHSDNHHIDHHLHGHHAHGHHSDDHHIDHHLHGHHTNGHHANGHHANGHHAHGHHANGHHANGHHAHGHHANGHHVHGHHCDDHHIDHHLHGHENHYDGHHAHGHHAHGHHCDDHHIDHHLHGHENHYDGHHVDPYVHGNYYDMHYYNGYNPINYVDKNCFFQDQQRNINHDNDSVDLKKLNYDLKFPPDNYLPNHKSCKKNDNCLNDIFYNKCYHNFKEHFDICHNCGKNCDLCFCYLNDECRCFDCMYVLFHSFDWNYLCINNETCKCYKCYNKNKIQSYKEKQRIYYDEGFSSDKSKRVVIDENEILEWLKSRDNEWIKFNNDANKLKDIIRSLGKDYKRKVFLEEYYNQKYEELNYKTCSFLNRVLYKYKTKYDIYILKRESVTSTERDITLSVINFIKNKAF